MTICDTKLYQMSENDPNTEIFKIFSVFGQTKCHGLPTVAEGGYSLRGFTLNSGKKNKKKTQGFEVKLRFVQKRQRQGIGRQMRQ